ncbi:MAG: hypothetical protein J6033_02225, partial [Lachnospiraceae bacterium]|nr:hypothetical protein [Lachnospiraceae bacterium]
AIVDEANDYLYAYAAADAAGVKALFAEELICRLMDPSLFEYFGLPETNEENRESNVTALLDRIVTSGAEYQVTAKNPSGGDQNITVQDYTVSWGVNSEDGSPVVSTLPVYTLENIDQVLICTDFNDRTGRGNNFLICDVDDGANAETDSTTIADAGGPGGAGGVRFVVNSINPATIKAGGMGRIETVLNEDDIYTIEVNGGAPGSFLRVTDPVQGADRIRLLKTSEKYLTVGGEGETKAYGMIGDNGKNIDSVWATSNDDTAVARVYVGDSTIHLYPLNGNAGLSNTDIISVELVDPSQADGVGLDTTNIADIKLTFNSNFYDEIPLKIVFEGGITKYITIVRVGLVIQYRYLGGDPNNGWDEGTNDWIVDHDTITHDYYGQAMPFDYTYFNPNNPEQILITATYFHPTNDPTGGASDYNLYLTFDNGSHRVVTPDDAEHNFNGRLDATNDKVASTTFIIGFEQAREYFDDYVWIGQLTETNYHEGGFYATVLNAGFDDDTNYSGTQMGSGKGVYWDGHIEFYN